MKHNEDWNLNSCFHTLWSIGCMAVMGCVEKGIPLLRDSDMFAYVSIYTGFWVQWFNLMQEREYNAILCVNRWSSHFFEGREWGPFFIVEKRMRKWEEKGEKRKKVLRIVPAYPVAYPEYKRLLLAIKSWIWHEIAKSRRRRSYGSRCG